MQIPQVPAHNADRILRPELLELLAGRSPVARQVVNGADGQRAFLILLMKRMQDKMRAFLSRGLDDHGLLIIGIDAAVCLNRGRIDYKNIQMKAASSAAQAEHDMPLGRAA